MTAGERDRLQDELDALLREAARLAKYDLTIENGRARRKFDALGPREAELRRLLALSAPTRAGR